MNSLKIVVVVVVVVGSCYNHWDGDRDLHGFLQVTEHSTEKLTVALTLVIGLR